MVRSPVVDEFQAEKRRLAQNAVREKFNVDLQPEVMIVEQAAAVVPAAS